MSFFSCIGPDDVPRLRDEHSFLERQLADVIGLAAADHRKDCETSWEVFAHNLERHMQYEENLLFPSFAQLGTAEQLRTVQFRAEHEEFRNLCQMLGSEFVQPTLSLGLLRELAGKLMAHKERESLALYPWLASLAPPRLSWQRLSPTTAPRELPCQEFSAPSAHVPKSWLMAELARGAI